MSRCYSNYSCGCGCNCGLDCNCSCCVGPRGPAGKSAYQIAVDNGFVGTEQQWLDSLVGPPGPFLSSFIEAVGGTQTIVSGANVVFDTAADSVDIAGTGITLNAAGTVFTINQAGLYHVEWSMNLSAATAPVLFGLIENGVPSSALANNALAGNYSSGALINVTAGDLPYTLSLHNFGSQVTIANSTLVADTAVSIRISRFAGGPSV